MRSAKSAKKNRFTTHHSGATMRFSSEDTIREINESRKWARKLIRRAGVAKAKSGWQMRKEWNALLLKEDEKRHAEAKACASSIIGHIVR